MVYDKGSFYLISLGIPYEKNMIEDLTEDEEKAVGEIEDILEAQGVKDPRYEVRRKDILMWRDEAGAKHYTVIDFESMPYKGYNPNITCGTTCEDGHKGMGKLTDQIERFYRSIGRGELTTDRVDEALFEIEGLTVTRKNLSDMRAAIKEKMPDLIEDGYEIFFILPNPDNPKQRLWHVDGTYAAGHYSRRYKRMHISLPFVLGEEDCVEAACDIAEHDWKELTRRIHYHDKGYARVKRVAEEESAAGKALIADYVRAARSGEGLAEASKALLEAGPFLVNARKDGEVYIVYIDRKPRSIKVGRGDHTLTFVAYDPDDLSQGGFFRSKSEKDTRLHRLEENSAGTLVFKRRRDKSHYERGVINTLRGYYEEYLAAKGRGERRARRGFYEYMIDSRVESKKWRGYLGSLWIKVAAESGEEEVAKVPWGERFKIALGYYMDVAGIDEGDAAMRTNVEDEVLERGEPLLGRAAAEPLDEMIKGEELRELDDEVSALDRKSRDTIEQRYGLKGEAPATLLAIGESLHLGKEQIRQIEKKRLADLKIRVGEPEPNPARIRLEERVASAAAWAKKNNIARLTSLVTDPLFIGMNRLRQAKVLNTITEGLAEGLLPEGGSYEDLLTAVIDRSIEEDMEMAREFMKTASEADDIPEAAYLELRIPVWTDEGVKEIMEAYMEVISEHSNGRFAGRVIQCYRMTGCRFEVTARPHIRGRIIGKSAVATEAVLSATPRLIGLLNMAVAGALLPDPVTGDGETAWRADHEALVYFINKQHRLLTGRDYFTPEEIAVFIDGRHNVDEMESLVTKKVRWMIIDLPPVHKVKCQYDRLILEASRAV
jgi:hypothetical protein